MIKVMVLGGAGFIGRHACLALHQAGANLVIGSRHPDQIETRLEPERWSYERRQVRVDQLTEPDAWSAVLQDIDAVLNCVGILRQCGAQTYQRVHCDGPAALAQYAALNDQRFIQVSALGLRRNAKSRFLSSKLLGEQAIKSTTGDWIIARPSLLDGDGGYGAWWLRAVAKLPLFVVPADAKGLLAALDEALRRSHTNNPAVCIVITSLVARLGAHFCDLFHFTPFSFGHWELLQQDNKPQENRLAELLGRPPKPVGVEFTEQNYRNDPS